MPALPDPLRLALGTLTVVPVPAPATIDRRVAGRAMLLAPVAALVPGVGAAVVLLGADATGLPPLAAAALGLGALALATRGLHLDGLADTADGLAASYDRERALTVMRTGDVGPAGAVTLLLSLVAQAASLAALLQQHGGWRAAVLTAAVVAASRVVLAPACSRLVPSARPSGLGATVAGSVPVAAAAALTLGSAVVVSLVAAATGAAWWQGALGVLLGLATAGVLLRRCVVRLGGMTGDVLGGCVEVTLTVLLLALSASG